MTSRAAVASALYTMRVCEGQELDGIDCTILRLVMSRIQIPRFHVGQNTLWGWPSQLV